MTGALRYQPGLHRYAVLVACSTLALIFAGGLVTTTGSGLSVPDWPLSFGKLMPEMRGGVLFEHGHRLIATTVGVLTIGLVVFLRYRESRQWVRRLGYAALGLVVLQGALGGLTVLLQLPLAVSVAHAGMAELFFGLATAIALFTSCGWLEADGGTADGGAPPLRTLALVTVVAVYAQILLGALVRHSGAGLAIPDFPLSYGRLVPPLGSMLVAYHFAHRVGALIASAFILWTVVRVLRDHAAVTPLRRPALALVALLALQVYLGALTVWSRRAIMPTTLHLLSGALIFVTTTVLALRAQRLLAPAAEESAKDGAVTGSLAA